MQEPTTVAAIEKAIRNIPDFPKPGIQFKDITPLLADARLFSGCIDLLTKEYQAGMVDTVVGIDARGFIFAAAAALKLQAGFVPVRKKGKLPYSTHEQSYDLEYGTDRVEIHTDAIHRGERVLVIDDLIATGGTALASVELIEQAGGEVVGCGFIIDLPDLGGAARLRERGLRVHTLCAFEGE